MMGGSGAGGSKNGGGKSITIVRCCTSNDAPQCHLFCEGTHIYLPLPLKIMSNTHVTWNSVNSSDNVYGKALTGLANGGSINELANSVGRTAKYLWGHKMNALMALGGIENSEFLFAQAGVAALPAKELSFDGVDFRTFQFSWQLVPLDENDSRQVHKMIKHVQEHMLPGAEAGIVGYPDLWAVNWKKGDKGMPIVKDCYVSSITVDYSAAGQYTFVHNTENEPVAFNVSITLKEASIFTRDDVKHDIYG